MVENTVLNNKILVFFNTNIFRNEGFDFQNRYFYTHMLEASCLKVRLDFWIPRMHDTTIIGLLAKKCRVMNRKRRSHEYLG